MRWGGVMLGSVLMQARHSRMVLPIERNPSGTACLWK
jgi:hypothetical protein